MSTKKHSNISISTFFHSFTFHLCIHISFSHSFYSSSSLIHFFIQVFPHQGLDIHYLKYPIEYSTMIQKYFGINTISPQQKESSDPRMIPNREQIIHRRFQKIYDYHHLCQSFVHEYYSKHQKMTSNEPRREIS